jgi:hypothetical protein
VIGSVGELDADVLVAGRHGRTVPG